MCVGVRRHETKHCVFLAPLCRSCILFCHFFFLVLSFLTSFRSPSLASCQYVALLLANFDNLCPCSPSVPFFCSSFTSIVLIFLPCSPLVPSSGSFHLPLCDYFSLFSFFLPVHPLLLNRLNLSSLCLSPSHSFHLFPFPAPFFVLCGFSSGVLSCHVHQKKNMHSGFVPFSFPFRSGRVPFSFPFRSGRVPFSLVLFS